MRIDPKDVFDAIEEAFVKNPNPQHWAIVKIVETHAERSGGKMNQSQIMQIWNTIPSLGPAVTGRISARLSDLTSRRFGPPLLEVVGKSIGESGKSQNDYQLTHAGRQRLQEDQYGHGAGVIDNPFDYAAAAKSDGMDRIGIMPCDSEWSAKMQAQTVATAREMQFFTSDDVYRRADGVGLSLTTMDPRAFGPIMMRVVKDGVCCKSDRPPVNSQRKTRHAAPLVVWQSLIFEG